jgi:hypothetical protein
VTDHVVIQARDALVARLKDQVASVGERVYLMHEVPPEEVSSDNSPFIVVQLGDDQDERAGMNNNGDVPDILEDIKLSIFVHCVVKMDGDAEQAAYNLRAEVETALLLDERRHHAGRHGLHAYPGRGGEQPRRCARPGRLQRGAAARGVDPPPRAQPDQLQLLIPRGRAPSFATPLTALAWSPARSFSF